MFAVDRKEQKKQSLSSLRHLAVSLLALISFACDTNLTGDLTEESSQVLELKLKGSTTSNLTLDENNDPVLIFVLSEEAPKDILLNWELVQTHGGGLNNDFSKLSGQLTILKSESSVTMTLPLIDDDIYEGLETYALYITNVASNFSGTINVEPLVLDLMDNDSLPAVNFLTAKSYYHEGDGVLPVGVVLSSPAEAALKVTYSLGGTASASDFSNVSELEELIFQPGETLKSIQLDILTDALDETDETIDIQLLTLTADADIGAVGALNNHDVNILDIDGDLTVQIVKQDPVTIIFDATPIYYTVIFNRKIDKAYQDLIFAEFGYDGTSAGLTGSVTNGVGEDEDRVYTLQIDSVDGDGTIVPSLPPGRFKANDNGLTNSAALTETAIVDLDTPENPISWALSSPANGSTSNDLTPVISGTGITFEEGSLVSIYTTSSCSTAIGTTTIAGGSFSVTNITYLGSGAEDGLKSYYGQVKDVADKLSACLDLSLSYTLLTTGSINPTVTITKASGQNSATSLLPIIYDVVFSEPIDSATFTISPDITQTGTATVDTWTLTNIDGTNWELRATAVSADGSIIPVIPISAILNTIGYDNDQTSDSTAAQVDFQTPTIPGPPTNFFAATLDGQINLIWDGCPDCTYDIYFDSVPGVTAGSPSATGLTSPNYSHTGLTNSVLQYYRVKAVHSALGTGPLNAEINAMPYTNICTSGDVESDCIISGIQVIPDNHKISLTGDLSIPIGGDLQSNVGQSISVVVKGTFEVSNGGLVNATFASLVAGALDMQAGGILTGDISALSVSTMTVAGTMNSNIFESNITNLNVPFGGTILADSRGSVSDVGTGKPAAYNDGGGGAGYGGLGGRSNGATNGGTTYGSQTNPIDLGSGGGAVGNNHGGGALKLFVSETLFVDGNISANGGYQGANNVHGGGSGGSIWIDAGVTNSGGAGVISGNGTITADGGHGTNTSTRQGGGGGGGRIAFYSVGYTFSGMVSVNGGNASYYAATGGDRGSFYQVISDVDSLCNSGDMASNNCTITNATYLGDNFILTGSTVTVNATGSIVGNFSIDLTGDLTLDAGAVLSAVDLGHGQGQGIGFGIGNDGGTGGGHGGIGGRPNGADIFGLSYGDETNPTTYGSGGGYTSWAGRGGGALKLFVQGTFTNNGFITVDSTDCNVASGCGGGAGGSIWIDVGITNTGGVGILTGTGAISATGGNGGSTSTRQGGGGGGGRVAIHTVGYAYRGSVAVEGGRRSYNNAKAGGNGSFYLVYSDQNSICDSGDMASLNCTVSSAIRLGNLTALDGTNLTVNATGSILGNFSMNLTGDLTIDAGAKLSAEAFGHSPGQGLGGGPQSDGGAGGGHGGIGGRPNGANIFGASYGDSVNPITYGSGGGYSSAAGFGGGAMKIVVQGTLTNNGSITANGQDAQSNGAGGAGGSIWIDVGLINSGLGLLTGVGTITADGGLGGGSSTRQSGGGGGGRIALHSNGYTFDGNVSVTGGAPSWYNTNAGERGSFHQVVTDIDTLCDSGTMGALNCTVTDFMTLGDGFSFSGSNLTVANGAIISGNYIINLTGDLTIAAGGILTAEGMGHTIGQGLGGGLQSGGGIGGGHAGVGGRSENGLSGLITYGNDANPVTYGSGGGSGASAGEGGGALKLIVQGTLTNDGLITADGINAASNGGGGGGGSLWIDVGLINAGTGLLTGSGSIRAAGGAGSYASSDYGGGGGGGRIAIHANGYEYRGLISVRGGVGASSTASAGGRGVFYLNFSDMDTLCDTGDMASNNCTLSSPVILSDAFTITGSNYTVASGGSLTGNLVINLTGNLTVDSGGAISADGRGFLNGYGPGVGGYYYGGAGGGHGGQGGRSQSAVNGGPSYGSLVAPITFGSGGRGGLTAGAGGGALKITVQGILTNNGSITANGETATGAADGGGAGGSIWVNATGGTGLLTGTGIFSVTGGAGVAVSSSYGGGGGGGRIALYSVTYNYRGLVNYSGGLGAAGYSLSGDTGTFYHSFSDVDSICDSGDMASSNCTVSTRIAMGDNKLLTGSTVIIDTTGELYGNINMDLTEDLIINTGGKINANQTGHPEGYGLGVGLTYGGGCGAGHGGEGARSHNSVGNGITYGSLTQPVTMGSGGRGGFGAGNGGGAIKLLITGKLTNNGSISADGADAGNYAGGAAGGSIWIDVGLQNPGTGIFEGAGAISAAGGNGSAASSAYGGGGGGGRISFYSVDYDYRQTPDITGGLKSGGFSADGEIGTFYQNITNLDSLCDTATSFATTCVISSVVTIGDGVIIAGASINNLTITATGTLTTIADSSSGQLILNNDFNIDGLGSFNVNLEHFEADNFIVNGTFSGNILDSSINTLTVSLTGSLNADGKGYKGRVPGKNALGQGFGTYLGGQAGGGGYGGVGGSGGSASAFGGIAYGAQALPIYLGSGGSAGIGDGGSGGGLLKLIVSGTLTVHGNLSANGGTGVLSGGGGSGGSLWIEAGTLTGDATGSISADGGDGSLSGSYIGGGGGGGRVGLFPAADSFAGTPQAAAGLNGGGASVDGGPGTVVNTAILPANIIVGSSTSFDGNFGGLAGADKSCEDLMHSQGMGGTWKALLSDSTDDAKTHVNITRNVSNLRYDTNLGPQEIAANAVALWDGAGSLTVGVAFDEVGVEIPTSTLVWTGSLSFPTGTDSGSNCNDWSGIVGTGTVGYIEASTSAWMETTPDSCANLARLYCVSQ